MVIPAVSPCELLPYLSKLYTKSKNTLQDDCRPHSYFGCMSGETLSQDEIDALISRTRYIEPVIIADLTSLVMPQIVSTEKTMLKRYYYALTHCGYEEQRVAKENLREAAFRVWLNKYGFLDKSDYIAFINNEVKKRGLGWKLHIRGA